ncbi:polyprenyl synthetase family protein [Desulfatiglans anilini]|uniref:polyprenyl synthetase family protein n=1 Tax=Desulfatiglans anilini TaxID=90728 RepID=UPI00041F84D0|nr:farnesyl diphosphate synthase [Desulfatiglans anilini]
MPDASVFDFKGYLKAKRDMVDRALRGMFPAPEGLAADIVDAMTYSLFAGGKRLRPILCITGAEVVGGSGAAVLPVACALECIHTYSLIHDDLPVMDDDDLRRGKPTSHKVYGEALALLAGDGLLTEAFDIMTRAELITGLPVDRLLRAIHVIAHASGYNGMVGGQVVDIQMEGRTADPAIVDFIHRHKTGDLITAAIVSGAVLGGGAEKDVAALESYGRKIGMAFQISDDILDIEGDQEIMGKPIGSDAAKQKMTYPALLGLEEARRVQKGLVEGAVEVIADFDQAAEPLRHLAAYIIQRKR